MSLGIFLPSKNKSDSLSEVIKTMYDCYIPSNVEGGYYKSPYSDYVINNKKYFDFTLTELGVYNSIYISICYNILNERKIRWTYIITDVNINYDVKLDIGTQLFNDNLYFEDYVPYYFGELNIITIKKFVIDFWNNKYYKSENVYKIDISRICESKYLDLQIY